MLHKCSDKNVFKAGELLLNGNVIVYPTDTLYGFGVDATNCNAINKLNKLKKRKQIYSIIVDSIKMLKAYSKISKNDINIISQYLPGPYTIILNENNNNLSPLVNLNKKTIGFRIPKSKFILDVVRYIKRPIITTSVNIHDKKALSNIKEIKMQFGNINIFYNNKNINSIGSTILDISNGTLEVLRNGDGGVVV